MPALARDPWLWPFASDSIWNMPLGSEALLVPAGITAASGVAVDPEILVRTRPGAPQRRILAPAAWEKREGGTRELGAARFDDDFVVPDARLHWTPNFCGAVLQPDGRTVEHLGPICRPREGSDVWAYRFGTTDLHGDGIRGSHGGSGLSALGGSIRRGELLGEAPIRHAIKVNLFCERFVHFGSGRPGFRWPADRADDYAAKNYKGSNPAVVMGSLLCLRPDLDLATLGLKTTPARKIARALQDYGAYVADDAAHDVFYVCCEEGVREEVAGALGVSMESDSGAYFDDIAKLLPLLHVVDNNAPDRIGGGGTRRAVLAPPLAETVANPLEPHAGPNLVPNAGMERGGEAADGWAMMSGEGALGRETAAPFKGEASLRLKSEGKAMARIQIPGEFSARTMTLSGRVRADGANAMLGLMCYTKDWKGINFIIAGNTTAGGWTEIAKTFALPEGTARVDVALLVEGKGSGFLDEARLEADGAALPAVEARQTPPKAENAWSPAQGFYPDYPEAWLNFHRSLKEQAAKGGVDLLFIGDSLTKGWDPAIWEKRYAPRKAANFGIGGDGTPQLLWRLENGGFEGLQPKVVVLMIGINNVWPGFSAEDTVKGIRTFVGRLRGEMPGARILLCGMLPVFDEDDAIREYIKTVNAGIAGLDDGKSVRFQDFGKEFVDANGKRREGFYDGDRLHLKAPGYQAWSEAMEPLLVELLARDGDE